MLFRRIRENWARQFEDDGDRERRDSRNDLSVTTLLDPTPNGVDGFGTSKYLLRDLSQASSDLASPITLEWQEDDGEFEGDDGSLVHAHGYILMMDERYFTQRSWPELYPFNVFVFKVAGITHYQKDANTHAFRAGERVVLERDPTNSYDSNAVKVLSADLKLFAGYVPRELSARISPLMGRLKHEREPGIVVRTYNVGQHRDGIEIVSAIGRLLTLTDE